MSISSPLSKHSSQRCPGCDRLVPAADRAEYSITGQSIRYVWHCDACEESFEQTVLGIVVDLAA